MSQRKYIQQAIPGKGVGLVATASIPRGTCIIAEPYLVACTILDNPKRKQPPEDIEQLRIALNGLARSKRTIFNQLAPQPQTRRAVVADIERFMTNCWPLTASERGVRLYGIFTTLSRLNHSCFPNSIYNWDAKQRKGTIYALMDIEGGTELTVSYIDDTYWVTVAERQKELNRTFKFTCHCEICYSDPSISATWNIWRANHRKTLREYYEALTMVHSGDGPLPEVLRRVGMDTLVTRADEYCRMVEQELGGISQRPKHYGLPPILDARLAAAYRTAAKYHELHSNPQRVIEYLWKAYCVDVVCYGEDSPDALGALEHINGVEGRVRAALEG